MFSLCHPHVLPHRQAFLDLNAPGRHRGGPPTCLKACASLRTPRFSPALNLLPPETLLELSYRRTTSDRLLPCQLPPLLSARICLVSLAIQ